MQYAARFGETTRGLLLRCMIYCVPMHWKGSSCSGSVREEAGELR
jgi:hypothetical protein